MIAIEHVHSSTLKLSLLVQLSQEHDNTYIVYALIAADPHHAASTAWHDQSNVFSADGASNASILYLFHCPLCQGHHPAGQPLYRRLPI